MSTDVGASNDFADGTISVVVAAGRQIGIVRWSGALYALLNVCTHQSGPVCTGILSARLTAARPGTMELDAATPVLACPWHGWEFDVRTGHALQDPEHRIRTFPVHELQGRVRVELTRDGAP